MRQRLVRGIVLALVVDVVVTHVEVDHPVVLVGPNDGIIPAVPDLVRFWPGAQRKAGRVYGEQNVDVRILPQVSFPAVPLTGRGAKRLGHMSSRRMVAVFDPENGRRRSPRVRSEEHTSELQSRLHLVCRLLLEKKKKKK